MRKLLIGLAGLAAVVAVTPATAQGVYFGAPGVSVGVGAPVYREHRYDYDRPRYRVQRSYDELVRLCAAKLSHYYYPEGRWIHKTNPPLRISSAQMIKARPVCRAFHVPTERQQPLCHWGAKTAEAAKPRK